MPMAWQSYLERAQGGSIDIVGPYFQPAQQVYEEPVVFVDRGAAYRKGREGFSVGDGDSAAETLDHRIPGDKNISDLAFVLGCLPDRFHQVRLLGFLGGRRDHELFNFGEAHHFLKGRPYPQRVLIDDKAVGHAAGSWQLELSGVFSLAVLETALVTLHGNVRYSLPQPTEIKPLSSLGLSNVASGSVGIHSNQPFFVFSEQP